MTTGADLIVAAESFLGEPYSTAPGRTSPTSGFKDCSGLIAAAYEVATGGIELGAYVSVTIWAQSNALGLSISRDAALDIAGACFLIPTDPLQGWGPNGHIGFSTGDGWTVEATPAAQGGVQRLPATYQPWGPNACLLPGIDYSNGGQGSAHQSDQEDHDMAYIAVGDAVMGRVAALIDGGRVVGDLFTGPTGAYDIPQSALDWNAVDGRGFQVKSFVGDPDRFAALLTPPAVTTVPGDCPDCPPGIDTATNDQLLAELDRRLP